MKFLCEWLGMGCDYEFEDDDEETVATTAEEHLKTHHPDEAVERDRVRAIIRGGGPIA